MPRLMTEPKWKVMCQYVDYPMGAGTPSTYKSGIETKEEAEKIAKAMSPTTPTDCCVLYWAEEDK